jgi:hypothetical protein
VPTLRGANAVEGGLPLTVGGKVIGAIGVSGAAPSRTGASPRQASTRWRRSRPAPGRGLCLQELRSSRSLTNTVFGSGFSGRSGKAARSAAITLGLRRRRKVLIFFFGQRRDPGRGRVVPTSGSNALAAALSGSRASVKRRLFSM